MRKIVFAGVASALLIAGCTTAERDAAVGGAVGAAAGGLIAGNVGGAIIGGAAGAIGGALIGQATRSGWCVYRDSRGRLYEDRCRR